MLEETREEQEEDAARLHLVAERTPQVLLQVADKGRVVVIDIGVGGGKPQEGVDAHQPLHQVYVVRLGLHLHREVEFVQDARPPVAFLIYMYIIMCEGRVAVVTVRGERRDEVQVPRREVVATRGQRDACRTLHDKIQACKGTPDIMEVPVAIMVGQADMKRQQMQFVDAVVFHFGAKIRKNRHFLPFLSHKVDLLP